MIYRNEKRTDERERINAQYYDIIRHIKWSRLVENTKQHCIHYSTYIHTNYIYLYQIVPSCFVKGMNPKSVRIQRHHDHRQAKSMYTFI